jgi:Macrocin-O-methyltransferase (TylF)
MINVEEVRMIAVIKKVISKIIQTHAEVTAREIMRYETDLFHQLQKIALTETLPYIQDRMSGAVCLKNSGEIFNYLIHKIDPEGLIMEFGVFKGRTITLIASKVSSDVHGFDSFEGLPEDWGGWKHPAGYFSLNGKLPNVPDNVILHKGWFNETLPEFTKKHKKNASLIHIHCDLYSSTKTVLDELADRIVPGTLLVFHEYFNYYGWKEHEFKAFQEFVAKNGIKYKYLAFSSSEAGQVALVILEKNSTCK